MPGTPYRIAAGFACGAAISFTPFLGLHFVLAASRRPGVAGQSGRLGHRDGGRQSLDLSPDLVLDLRPGTDPAGPRGLGRSAVRTCPLAISSTRPLEILWPMTVGGLPTALAAWVIAYLIMHRIVSGYQQARRIRRVRRKLRRRARERDHAAKDHGAKTTAA